MPPVAQLESMLDGLKLTPLGVVGPRGSRRHLPSHALHFGVVAASVRCALGPASLLLVGSITALSTIVPLLTPAALLDRLIESSVSVSAADAAAIRQRLLALDHSGVSLCGCITLDDAVTRKLCASTSTRT